MKLRVCFVLMSVAGALAFPNGAPRNRKLCRTLKPRHGDSRAQDSAAPYAITPSKSKIPIGSSVNVAITANAGKFYKGFIMQARPRMIGNVQYIKPLGSFKILDPANSKTLDCLSSFNNTVTHTNPQKKTSTNFVWTPPPKYNGSVYFRASFVQDFNTFWINVSSHIVVGETASLDVSTRSSGEEEIVLYSDESDLSTSEENNGEVYGNREIYEDCGLKKACFGVPEKCVSNGSCDILLTVAEKFNDFEFELLGKLVKFVAMSTSENEKLVTQNIITCSFDNNSVVLQSVAYNMYQTDDIQPHDLINSSYSNGVIYCKFRKREIVDITTYSNDPSDNFVSLAAGNYVDNDIIDFNNIHFEFFPFSNALSEISQIRETSRNYLKKKLSFQKQLVDWFYFFVDYISILG